MLPLDLWQFCIIDYLEYIDQCKLVTHIPSLQLTNLIRLPDLTDEGIKHMTLHTLHTYRNKKITDEGIKHMNIVNYKN
jgi:hypothetical protein